jgi:hypothetical protein
VETRKPDGVWCSGFIAQQGYSLQLVRHHGNFVRTTSFMYLPLTALTLVFGNYGNTFTGLVIWKHRSSQNHVYLLDKPASCLWSLHQHMDVQRYKFHVW